MTKKRPMTRSENMARVKSRNTKPEQLLRKALWAAGLRYRKQRRVEKIRPDVVFIGAKVAVFLDGCQWHGCPDHYVRPRTRTDFWQDKLLVNVDRDTRQTRRLRERGWRVYRVWEHDIWENLDAVVEDIRQMVRDGASLTRQDWRVYHCSLLDAETDLERRFMRLLDDPNETQEVDRIRNTRRWKRKVS